MEKRYDVAIVGGGIAGYTAALTAKSLKMDALWLGEVGFGEKLSKAEYVRNFPALVGNGSDFVERLLQQAKHEGIVITPARVDGVYALGSEFLLTAAGEEYHATAVILATGMERRASVKGEREFLGRGVSYCAVCDGALYRGKPIAVVISAPKFAEEVEYLAGFASEVHCFCLYPDPVFHAPNIRVCSALPRAIEGGMRVEKLVYDGGEVGVNGVFFLKDSAPPEALVGGLKTKDGHVEVGRDCATNLAGLFAAGDVTGTPYQYVKAAGEGCVAAYSARAYVNAQKGANK